MNLVSGLVVIPRKNINHTDIRASQVAVVVKNSSANSGDTRDLGLIPGSGRSPGGGLGNLLQYSCLQNLMDREVGGLTVHKVAKSRTRLR